MAQISTGTWWRMFPSSLNDVSALRLHSDRGSAASRLWAAWSAARTTHPVPRASGSASSWLRLTSTASRRASAPMASGTSPMLLVERLRRARESEHAARGGKEARRLPSRSTSSTPPPPRARKAPRAGGRTSHPCMRPARHPVLRADPSSPATSASRPLGASSPPECASREGGSARRVELPVLPRRGRAGGSCTDASSPRRPVWDPATPRLCRSVLGPTPGSLTPGCSPAAAPPTIARCSVYCLTVAGEWRKVVKARTWR
mmetsp:Transcript_46195/g.147825  ORF Transcript_46195/g.147825 Transcript_46195/m.147825 type:complete len:260 (+) Transcript_46195:379-1158(+)